MSKRCNECTLIKPLSEFFKDKNNKTDGHYSICKECKKASTYRWRDKNTSAYNEQMRQYRKENKERLNRARNLRKYGLTEERYAKILSEQNNCCGICEKPGLDLVIDHLHGSTLVRGLLCYTCNRNMHLVDNTELLNKSLAYKNKQRGDK